MKWSQELDSQIQYALNRKAEEVKEEDGLYYQIRKQIYIKENEQEMGKKRMSKKAILIGIGTAILATGTVLAGQISGWNMTLLKSYGEAPTAEQVKEDSGFNPKFLNELPGGYTFMMASASRGELIDENSRVSEQGTEFVLRYFAPGEDEDYAIAFFASDIKENMDSWGAVKPIIIEEKGMIFKFGDWKTKYVSKGYKLTEEEQKQVDQKELFIEETDEEWLLEMGAEHRQMIMWMEDGIEYTLLSANNHQFTQKEFVEMAKAIMNAKNRR